LLGLFFKILVRCGLKIDNESLFSENEKCIAIFDCEKELIPQALILKYGVPKHYSLRGKIFFDGDVLQLYYEAFRYFWYEPHFLTKVLLRLGRYSYLISITNCKVIVASAEYSFASSILTGLCEKKSIKHVNIMHGEKWLDCIDAFCGFHEFFLWDNHYISIFSTLRARVDEYIVAKPGILIDVMPRNVLELRYDYTYYLGGFDLSPANLINIKISMEMLMKNGKNVCVRMHPLYGDRAKIEALFQGFQIEIPNNVTVLESLRSTRAAIGLSTTIFWQAEALGLPIILDDFSNPDFYIKLSCLRDLWVSRPHTRLSLLLLSQPADFL
jgi:hypothetical protein